MLLWPGNGDICKILCEIAHELCKTKPISYCVVRIAYVVIGGNKANLFRIAYCVMRIAKRNLKKQSQFGKGSNRRNVRFNKVL